MILEPSAYVPRVDIIPEDIVVAKGQNAWFNCSVGDSFTKTDWLIWYWVSSINKTVRIFSAQIKQSPSEAVFTHPEKFSIYGRYNLIVSDVQFADQGEFVCAISNRVNHTAALTVVGKIGGIFFIIISIQVNVL